MSRKIILSLAAAATVAVATLTSFSADARGFGGGGFGGGRSFGGGGARFASFTGHGGRTLTPIFPGRPGRPGRPIIPIVPIHPIVPVHPILPPIAFHDHHHHWVLRDGRWVVIEGVVDEEPALGCRTRPLHLPDQDLHAERPCGVRRCLHQGIRQCFGRQQRRCDTTADYAGCGNGSADDSGADGTELRRPHL